MVGILLPKYHLSAIQFCLAFATTLLWFSQFSRLHAMLFPIFSFSALISLSEVKNLFRDIMFARCHDFHWRLKKTVNSMLLFILCQEEAQRGHGFFLSH